VEQCATASWFAARFQWGTHGENSEKMMRKSGGNMKKSWGTMFFLIIKTPLESQGISSFNQFQRVLCQTNDFLFPGDAATAARLLTRIWGCAGMPRLVQLWCYHFLQGPQQEGETVRSVDLLLIYRIEF